MRYAEKGWEGGRLMGKCYLGLGNIVFIVVFFFKWWLVEPVRFGSIGLRLYKPKPNRTGIFL